MFGKIPEVALAFAERIDTVYGQGVAPARTGLAPRDLINSRFVRSFSLALPVSYADWIVCPKATAKLPKIATFREWLLAKTAEDARRMSETSRKAAR